MASRISKEHDSVCLSGGQSLPTASTIVAKHMPYRSTGRHSPGHWALAPPTKWWSRCDLIHNPQFVACVCSVTAQGCNYAISAASHSGGVVIRKEGARLQYLVVQARKEPLGWVPKRHIDQNESAEQAARREVLEETGVETAVRDVLDTVEFSTPRERVKAQFYLVEALSEGSPGKGRERKWLNIDDAMQELRFKEARWLVW